MSGRAHLRPDLHRMHVKLDSAPDRAVIIDKNGDAWQKSSYLGFWCRAFDGNGTDAFALAQNADGATFVAVPGGESKPESTRGGTQK